MCVWLLRQGCFVHQLHVLIVRSALYMRGLHHVDPLMPPPPHLYTPAMALASLSSSTSTCVCANTPSVSQPTVASSGGVWDTDTQSIESVCITPLALLCLVIINNLPLPPSISPINSSSFSSSSSSSSPLLLPPLPPPPLPPPPLHPPPSLLLYLPPLLFLFPPPPPCPIAKLLYVYT